MNCSNIFYKNFCPSLQSLALQKIIQEELNFESLPLSLRQKCMNITHNCNGTFKLTEIQYKAYDANSWENERISFTEDIVDVLGK